MFQPNKDFDPVNDADILWRYQDIPRYLDLLLKQQLFFSRADKFEDPFEGLVTRKHKEKLVQQESGEIAHDGRTEEAVTAFKQKIEHIEKEHVVQRSFITINSWHCNTAENYSMWKIYARGTYGIAIQTTFGRLKRCFNVTDKQVFIGKVAYYDTACEMDSLTSPLLPFLRKRNIYQYENEVRCCHVIPHNDKAFNWQAQGNNDGVFIDVNMDTLIERIYISPYSPKWIRDIIEGTNKKFNLDKEIVHSTVFDSKDY